VSPQRPICNTYVARKIARGTLVYGVNTIVAIACLNGYNQEDAVLINKHSLDRGLFRVLYGHEFSAREEMDEMKGVSTSFSDPRKVAGIKPKKGLNYNKLNKDGLLSVGTEVEPNDVMFGVVQTNK